MLHIITYLIVGILVSIVFGIVIVRVLQKKRMEEARVRGIKSALKEQEQFELLRKLEGKLNTPYFGEQDLSTSKRREIKR